MKTSEIYSQIENNSNNFNIVYNPGVSFSKTTWNMETDQGEVTGNLKFIIKYKEVFFSVEYNCLFFVMHPSPGKGLAVFPELKDIEYSHLKAYHNFKDAEKAFSNKFTQKGSIQLKSFDNIEYIKKYISSLAKDIYRKSSGTEVELNI